MTNPNSLTTRLTEFITKLYPWGHGHQIKAFVAFVEALLEARSLAYKPRWPRPLKTRKLLSNVSRAFCTIREPTKDLAQGVVTEFVSHIAGAPQGVRLRKNKALPTYWRSYDEGTFK